MNEYLYLSYSYHLSRVCTNLQDSESVCFHETKSCFHCYHCIFQTTERKVLQITKAPDSAETPYFYLWSETADRLQTQFYFTGTKAMNLVLCLFNQWWLVSFKHFKNAKGSSSESKGFTWHRKETRPCGTVTWPHVLPEHSGRAGIRVTWLNEDITIWNISFPSRSSLLSF